MQENQVSPWKSPMTIFIHTRPSSAVNSIRAQSRENILINLNKSSKIKINTVWPNMRKDAHFSLSASENEIESRPSKAEIERNFTYNSWSTSKRNFKMNWKKSGNRLIKPRQKYPNFAQRIKQYFITYFRLLALLPGPNCKANYKEF